ncbi:MAG: glycosyltransferase, partial [Syntrophomonadaceae bacterium]|nr:glycosyltransferase [Syntrophomonadaceae bacterium]
STANVANVFSRVEDRIVVSVHGYESIARRGANGLVNRLVFSRADVVACVARKMARDLAALYHIDGDKIVTLYNPYDFDRINDQARQPIDRNFGHPAIVTMGRLEKVKGYRHLLRIFVRVQEVIPACRLVFVGDGSQREELEQMAADLGVADKVVFTGRQANPFAYISRCDLCSLTSINEGFPNALVEAMACGLPVIATDCRSGPREIISATYSDEQTSEVEWSDFGVLTPAFAADDSEEPELEKKYAEAVLLLLTDDQLRADYQVRGRERARAFSFAAYRENIIRILEGDLAAGD